MSSIEKTLSEIRPSLRIVAPLTYYISWGFAIFNVLVSAPLYLIGDFKFVLVGAISIKIWSALFMLTGFLFAYGLVVNNWRLTRNLMLAGVAIKSAWLMELLARAVTGRSFILVAIWALILYLQIVTYIYFTPVRSKNAG